MKVIVIIGLGEFPDVHKIKTWCVSRDPDGQVLGFYFETIRKYQSGKQVNTLFSSNRHLNYLCEITPKLLPFQTWDPRGFSLCPLFFESSPPKLMQKDSVAARGIFPFLRGGTNTFFAALGPNVQNSRNLLLCLAGVSNPKKRLLQRRDNRGRIADSHLPGMQPMEIGAGMFRFSQMCKISNETISNVTSASSRCKWEGSLPR